MAPEEDGVGQGTLSGLQVSHTVAEMDYLLGMAEVEKDGL